MGYKNANRALPRKLLCAVQKYIDGEYIYIPRKEDRKQLWGANTDTRKNILERNREIVTKRLAGHSVKDLAEQYYLSPKTIYKIINTARKG